MKRIFIILFLFSINFPLLKSQDSSFFNITSETFIYVEDMPFYIENKEKISFCDFLNQRTSCKISNKKNGFKFFVKLLVNKDGEIEKYYISGLKDVFKNEIESAILRMDKWNPGILKHEKVNVILNYEFSLSKKCYRAIQ